MSCSKSELDIWKIRFAEGDLPPGGYDHLDNARLATGNFLHISQEAAKIREGSHRGAEDVQVILDAKLAFEIFRHLCCAMVGRPLAALFAHLAL